MMKNKIYLLFDGLKNTHATNELKHPVEIADN